MKQHSYIKDQKNTWTNKTRPTCEGVQLALASVPHTHTPTDSCSLAYHASSNRMQDLARRPHYLCRHDGGLVQRNCSINSVTLMQGVLGFMPFANGQWRHRRSRSAVKVNYKVKNTTCYRTEPERRCPALKDWTFTGN